MPSRIAVWIAAATSFAIGCNSRPRAPAIVSESIYQNDAEGFRLRAPEGWVLHAKTALPPGKPVPQERLLVGYKRFATTQASFEVSCVDLPADANLSAILTGKRTGPDAWKPVREPEPATMNETSGTRLSFMQGTGAKATLKETVAVRRGGRVYFFTLIASPNDVTARDEARRVIAGVEWKAN